MCQQVVLGELRASQQQSVSSPAVCVLCAGSSSGADPDHWTLGADVDLIVSVDFSL